MATSGAKRLPRFDYSQHGAYFVTICARDRRCLFGTVLDEKTLFSPIGAMVEDCWRKISEHCPEVTLDSFVVMPNHVHGIIMVGAGHARRLPVIVGSFKAAVSKRAGVPVWQRNYYEHVVRGEDHLNRIRRYIDNNPLFWSVDKENPEYRP